MAKHRWHCGICHSDLLVTRKGKGTKYLFCPRCDRQMAYYNIAPLVAAALSSLIPMAIEKGSELLSKPKADGATSAPLSVTNHQRHYTSSADRLLKLIEAERRLR